MRLLDAAGVAELARTRVADQLARDGLVLVRQGSLAEVRGLLAEWTEPAAHPHDQEVGLTILTPQQRGAGGAGFSREPLALHTDRSLQPNPPSVLAAVMVSPSVTGGQALLADGAAVLATLRRSFPAPVIDQLCLRTAAGDAIPIFATEGGAKGGLVRIRFRDDELAVPWATGGTHQVLAAFRDSILEGTRVLPMQAGDGYILHNHRYLHGRTGFTGHRRLARMLATVSCGRLAWLNQGFSVADA